MADRAFYESALQMPAVQGGLAAIRAGEGTPDEAGYQRMFGGSQFTDLSQHPRRVNSSGGYSSDAAGAYQFLSTTWDPLAKELGLSDFSPRSQDIAATALMDRALRRKGMSLETLAKEGMSARVQDALAPTWASFPTLAGKSYYGQPVKDRETLMRAFQQGAQGGSGGASAGQLPEPASRGSLTDPLDAMLRAFATTSPTGLPARNGIVDFGGERRPRSGGDGGVEDLTRTYALTALEQSASAAQMRQGRGGMRMAGAALAPLPGLLAAATGAGTGRSDRQLLPGLEAPGPAQSETPITAGGSGGGVVYEVDGIGPTSTGPHLDIKQLNRQRFDPAILDRYVRVGGKPLSAYPVTNTQEQHEARGSHGIDYGIERGTPVELINGAQTLSSVPTEHGLALRFRTPDGDFQFLHGRLPRRR